jgi:HTH-type transcriptional regulator/antitoxin HigA
VISHQPNEQQQPPPPGDYIRQELGARGWTQSDLARILGRPLPTVNGIIQGKHAIMPEMAIALGEAFGTGPEVWMQREASYRLSLAKDGDAGVRKRARLYEVAPIKELQSRGWIGPADDPDALEKELLTFFEVDSLDAEPEIVASFRRTAPDEPLTPALKAWCFRARHLARALKVAPFLDGRLGECEKELRRLAAFPKEARKVPRVLAAYGIRFVVVEPLSGSKADGAAFWLNPRAPVIVLSLRYDRVD